MVMTIAPQVGEARKARRVLSAPLLAFSAGAVSSAVALFGLSGSLGAAAFGRLPAGSAIQGALLVGVVVVATTYGLGYLARRPLPLPRSYRQVPKLWREVFSPATAALLYGLGLGFGLFTRVPYVTFYLALALSFVSASPLIGVVTGVIFGLARTAPLLWYRRKGVALGESVAISDQLARWEPPVQRITGWVLIAAGSLLAISVALT